jgi:hypothetical protein
MIEPVEAEPGPGRVGRGTERRSGLGLTRYVVLMRLSELPDAFFG